MRIGTDLYQKLGLKDFASMQEVKKAYRGLALQHHPDRGGDPEKMKEINSIFEVFQKYKDQYDAQLRVKKYGAPAPQVQNVKVVWSYAWTSGGGTTTSATGGW